MSDEYPKPHDVTVITRKVDAGVDDGREPEIYYGVMVDGHMLCTGGNELVDVEHRPGLAIVRVPVVADQVRVVPLDEFLVPPKPRPTAPRTRIEKYTSEESVRSEKHRFAIIDVQSGEQIGSSAGGYANKRFRDAIVRRFADAMDAKVVDR